jgi:cell division protein ZapA
MAQVNLQINGRDYLIACKDGEEKHLSFLADYINTQVEGLVDNVGQVGEARLLLMASLLVADELAETSQELDNLKAGGTETVLQEDAGQRSVEMDRLSQRIEDIAARLENP